MGSRRAERTGRCEEGFGGRGWARPVIWTIALASTAARLPASTPDLESAVSAMARVGGAWAPSFSPDGTRLALISNLTGVPQVWVVASESGWPDLVTPLSDPVGSVFWAPNGSALAFTVAPGGGMNEQVYTARADGTGLRRLTPGGKETNRLGGWTHDGRELILGSNLRSGASIDGYLLDVAGGQTRGTTTGGGINSFIDISRDGKKGIVYHLASRGDNNLFLVDLATGGETLLTPHDGPGTFDGGTFSPDGRTILLTSNKDRDLVAFARIKVGSDGGPGPIETLAAREDAELQEFAVDDAGTTAALVWNIAGKSELAFLDLATGHSSPGPELPAEIAGGVTFSKDGHLLAMTLSGAAAPQDIWILDRRNQHLRQVTRSPHPEVDLGQLVRPTLVRFKAQDGLDLTGWLYRPRNSTIPGPLVLSFHGGPEGQERPAFRYDYQALLAQGIAILAPNVRGSGGFGKRFVNLDNGALRENGIKDIKSCVDFVVESRIADPKRIGIEGGSYGGYMTMAGLTEFPELFAAGADYFGVVNFITFFEHTEPWMAAISKVKYGDPATQADLLRRLSPINKVDRVIAPTIVLHGANDTNVPVVEADQVVANLKKRGVPVEYVLFPDEGHGFRKIPNRIQATLSVVRWFSRYLLPEASH